MKVSDFHQQPDVMFGSLRNIRFDRCVHNETEIEGDVRRRVGHLPSVLPSFPMMHFMARMICSVTGGDMAEA